MFGLEDMWADKYSTLKSAIEKTIEKLKTIRDTSSYFMRKMIQDVMDDLEKALIEADKIEAW